MAMTRAEVIEKLISEPGGEFELTTDTSLGYPIKVYKHAPPTLRAYFETTKRYGDRTFLVYQDEEITFAEHYRQVASLAHFLRIKGIKKGDRIAIGMRNYPEWVVSFWAVQALGGIVVALNAWWTGPELAYALEDSTPSALLIDGERLERIAPQLPGMDIKALVVTRRGEAGSQGTDWADATGMDHDSLPAEEIGPNDYATILYTSGTTGRSKGAVATNRNHVTNIMNTLLGGAVVRGMLGDFSKLDPAAMPQGAVLQTFPYFHIGGMSGLYLATIMGSKVCLMYKWNAAEAVELVVKHKISSVAGVPIVVRQLLEAAASANADITSLLGIASGGAPVPPDLIRRIGKDFQQKTSPGNGYGLTETTSAVISNGGMEYLEHPDSIGKPVPTCEVKIVGENGETLGDEQIGEVWMRGPNIIPGYWKNPAATEAAFGGGWFRSGDLGYRSKEGFYYVVDRKKDVIIRGGENVYCAEVEAAILEHPMVKDVAVVGLPDTDYGEQVAAVIQVRDKAKAADLPFELRESLGNTLAKFKIPTSYQLTEDDLPRTATGKVLKRELREMFGKKAAA